jgi:DHA1 family tetracycline resistance protein-like MFS transporter
MALLNLLYGYFVLPESLPPERRKGFSWRALSPFASLRDLAGLQGVGWLVAVVGLSSLAQFVQISSWVLFTGFKFGWGPLENGWSLAAVGAMSVIVQGFLFGKLLRRFKPRQLAIAGLASSAISYLAIGGVPRDWMLFVAIGGNVLGYTVAASLQSIVSAAADARDQGRALGAVNAVNSLTSVVAPMIGPPLLAAVSHYPAGDWRIGVPFFVCATLQTVAMALAILHFRRQRRQG